MNFGRYLETRSAEIAAGLEKALRASAKTPPPALLRDAMRYALLNGGKRIRPVLCLATCEAVGGKKRDALPAALAVEALHTYTLVHDDLPCMDDDDFRRGFPTVHKKYGEAEAVLVGDALQAFAFEQLTKLPPGTLPQALNALCAVAGASGVIGGQWSDVTGKPPHTPAFVDYVRQHKTADMFSCAAELGAMCGGGTAKELRAVADYGRHLGMAFQIIDDILDEPERQTKPKGERELSCLDIWSLEQARIHARKHTDAAMTALKKVSGKTDVLEALLGHLLAREF